MATNIYAVCNQKGGVGKTVTAVNPGIGLAREGKCVRIIHHEESVDLLPANIKLSGMEVTLVNTMNRETILQDYLKTVCDNYDVVILDCCSFLGMLTINALATADKVLIYPCRPPITFLSKD